ncbi:DDE-type integrase/transposase/recombinase [Mycoplasma procyoni]|uniref:DDE-type integrase/transposase/recombinase n=1 Tax=Mycoplasma procyoni TaxID=568784 RepID=UPI00197C5691|nr:DDE-type integrase/transposase/recombinase [Mycoplasma procyoni]MBN3535142.1 transposase family protein [Mycoplasma procyoni]
MSRKQFTKEQKIKYCKILEKSGMRKTVELFLNEFSERYELNSSDLNYKNAYSRAKLNAVQLLKKWIKLYHIDEMKLESMTGKIMSSKRGRPPKSRQQKQREDDEWMIVRIIKELRRRYKITDEEIHEIYREELEKNENKKETSQKSVNASNVTKFFETTRTNLYRKIRPKSQKQRRHEKYKNEIFNAIKICSEISGKTMGRDKMYHTIINNEIKEISNENWSNITEHEFRLFYKEFGYKSTAYKGKSAKPPKEDKYRKVWAENYLQSFEAEYPGQVLTADIKFVKRPDGYYYLHVVRDDFSNMILDYELQETRTAEDTINLVKRAIKKHSIKPEIFHSDHGVEYANFEFKKFLEDNEIIQSMSRKGVSTDNRGSEYLFACFEVEMFRLNREKFNSKWSIINSIDQYANYYNFQRIQSNLNWKTPAEIFGFKNQKMNYNLNTRRFTNYFEFR